MGAPRHEEWTARQASTARLLRVGAQPHSAAFRKNGGQTRRDQDGVTTTPSIPTVPTPLHSEKLPPMAVNSPLRRTVADRAAVRHERHRPFARLSTTCDQLSERGPGRASIGICTRAEQAGIAHAASARAVQRRNARIPQFDEMRRGRRLAAQRDRRRVSDRNLMLLDEGGTEQPVAHRQLAHGIGTTTPPDGRWPPARSGTAGFVANDYFPPRDRLGAAAPWPVTPRPRGRVQLFD